MSVCPTALGFLVPRAAHLSPVNLLARTEARLGLVEVAGCLAEGNKGEVACESLCAFLLVAIVVEDFTVDMGGIFHSF